MEKPARVMPQASSAPQYTALGIRLSALRAVVLPMTPSLSPPDSRLVIIRYSRLRNSVLISGGVGLCAARRNSQGMNRTYRSRVWT